MKCATHDSLVCIIIYWSRTYETRGHRHTCVYGKEKLTRMLRIPVYTYICSKSFPWMTRWHLASPSTGWVQSTAEEYDVLELQNNIILKVAKKINRSNLLSFYQICYFNILLNYSLSHMVTFLVFTIYVFSNNLDIGLTQRNHLYIVFDMDDSYECKNQQ